MIKNQFSEEEFDVPSETGDNFYLNETDRPYHSLLTAILRDGVLKQNRTGVKTYSIFGPQISFQNVNQYFPLISTRKIFTKSVIGEILWFLSGSTNKYDLERDYGIKIWRHWGDDETGEMGPIYGHQWVNWNQEGINQLQNVIHTLKTNPDDRRMIVTAWNPSQIDQMALPPCHWSFQFYSAQYPNESHRRLSLKMNIRSWDTFVGGPFNIAGYAIILYMMANEVRMIPQDLIISAGDAHIYEDHVDYIIKQLNRESKSESPKLKIPNKKNFWEYELNDFQLEGYDPHPNWKNIPIAV